MVTPNNLPFTDKLALLMHLDINSCFATIEQQANPFLRGKPIAVAHNLNNGCILAASIEAKRFGIKTGMRMKDARKLCPNLITLETDSEKYRFVHLQLKELLLQYSEEVFPKSIDEFIINFSNSPSKKRDLNLVAKEIKQRIKKEIGDWITVSIGIAPNRYLAKVAAGLIKPDGLVVLDKNTHLQWYKKMQLTQLTGISRGNSRRLHTGRIYSVLDLYYASPFQSKAAFRSILGFLWYYRLRGYEVDNLPDVRKSYGNSYSPPGKFRTKEEVSPLLQKLTQKMAERLRNGGYQSRGVHLGISFKDDTFYHHGMLLPHYLFSSNDIWQVVLKIYATFPDQAYVRTLHVTCFELAPLQNIQCELFSNTDKKYRLAKTVDQINAIWGHFTVIPARMIDTKGEVPDRIGFGNVRELHGR